MDPRIEWAKQLFDEWKYRHERVNNLLYRYAWYLVILAVLPSKLPGAPTRFTHNQIKARVEKQIRDICPIREKIVFDANTRLGDLGCDDIDKNELVLAIEEAFDLEISDAESETWDTIGAINAYVHRRLGGRVRGGDGRAGE